MRSEELEDVERQLLGIVEEHERLKSSVPEELRAEYELLIVKHRELRITLEKYHLVPMVTYQGDASGEGHYIPEEDSDSRGQENIGPVRKRTKPKNKKKTSAAVAAVNLTGDASTSKSAEAATGSEATRKEPLLPVESSSSQAQATVSLGRPKHVQNVPLHAHSSPNLGDDTQLMRTPADRRRTVHRQDASIGHHDPFNWQLSSESYGEFIPESDSEHQASRRDSDASDVHFNTDVFGTANAPLANFEQLADTIAPIKDESVREAVAEQVHDIHRKYVNLVETNSGLRMQLSEIAIERSGLRSEIELLKDEKECLVQMIGKEKADTFLTTSQEPSESEYYSCVENSKTGVKSQLGQSRPQVQELEQTIHKLREQNEILVQENLKLTSQLEPHTPKAAWEPGEPSGDLEFDFESFKAGDSPTSLSEPSSPISPRTGRKKTLELEKKSRKLKEQNDLLVQDNLTLTSKFESQVAKAAWEVKTMKSSYEEEIKELKISLGNYQEESARLKDAYTELKLKYEVLTDSENKESNMQIISELDRSRQSRKGSDSQEVIADVTFEKPVKQLVSQDSFSSASGDEIILDDDNDAASLRSKNRELQKDIRDLKKKIKLSEDASYTISLQKKNKTLQEENQELQTVIDRATNMRELQQLRKRDRALSVENEELRMKLNEAILQPNIEVDSLRERSILLEERNRSLFERLDNDVIKAEEDLMELRRRCDSLLQEKEEIEDEFKTYREKLDKVLLNLQHKFEEALEENSLLHGQINSTKDTAQQSVHQMQVQFEDLSREHEILQYESEREKDKNRKEMNDFRNKVESLQKENQDLKKDLDSAQKEVNAFRESVDSYNDELKDQNTTLKREVMELSQKSEEDDNNIDGLQHELNELKSRYDDVQKYCDEIKTDLTNRNKELSVKLEEVEKDNEMMSESMKDLKNAKASLTEELSDLQGWYETKEREYLDKISRLAEETKTLKMELNTTQNQLAETNKKVTELEKHVEEGDKRNRDLDTLNTEYKGRVATLVHKLEAFQREIAVSEEEKRKLKDEVNEVMAGIEELADFDAEVWKTKQAVLDELNDLKTQYDVLQGKFKSLIDDKEYINAANAVIKAERDEMAQQFSKTNQENSKLRQDISDLITSIEELTDFDTEMWKSKESLVGELKNLQQKYNRVQKEREEEAELQPATPVVDQVFVMKTGSRTHSESDDFGNLKQQIQNVMSENEILKTYVQTLKATHEALKQNHEDCLKEKEALGQDVKDLMATLEELVAFDAEMWKGKTAAAGELQDMRDRYNDMQRTVQRKQEEIERRKLEKETVIVEKLVTKEVASTHLDVENGVLKQQLSEARMSIDLVRRDYEDVVRERELLKDDVKELMASMEELVNFDAEIWKSKSAMSGELQETRSKYEVLQQLLMKKQQEMQDRNLDKEKITEQRPFAAHIVSAESDFEAENKRFKEQLLEMSFDLRSLREDYDQVLKERDALSGDVKELMVSIGELVALDAEIWKSRTEMSGNFDAMTEKHKELEGILRSKEKDIEERKVKQREERQMLQERKEYDLAQMRSGRFVVEQEPPSIWMDEKGTQLRCVVNMTESPQRRLSPEKNWQDRYVNMQWKYVDFINTIEEMSEPMSPGRSKSRGVSESSSKMERRSPVRKLTFSDSDFTSLPPRQTEVTLTGEMGCDQCMILLADNDRLRDNLSKLQNDLMSTRLDRLEVETSYSERNFFKEQKEHLEEEMQTLLRTFREEKHEINEGLKNLQERNETLVKENATLKNKIDTEEQKYREALHKNRTETLAKASQNEITDNQELIQQLQFADSEIKSLEEKVKSVLEERTVLDIQVEHLKRECRLCERHIKDLEKEVETQYVQLDEMTLEHRELIEILAETKLQLEINRQHQARNVGKMEEAVSRLEETMSLGSGTSTPRGASGSVSVVSDQESPPREMPDSEHSASKTIQTISNVSPPTAESTQESEREHMTLSSDKTQAVKLIPAASTDLITGNAKILEELARIQERYAQLEEQREIEVKQLEEQETLIKSFREQLTSYVGDLDEECIVRNLEKNIQILERERTDLRVKIKSSEDRIVDLVAAGAAAEERFRRERAHLLERLGEKEQIQVDLMKKVEILERHIRRQWNLEVMRHQRNLLEAEMEKQKQVFEMELDTIDTVIRERAGVLSSERGHIVARLDHLEDLIGRVGHSDSAAVTGDVSQTALSGTTAQSNTGPSSTSVPADGILQVGISHAAPSANAISSPDEVFRNTSFPSLSGAARPHTFREPQLDRLSGMKTELERRYRLAIAKLRTNLKSEASKQRKRSKPQQP